MQKERRSFFKLIAALGMLPLIGLELEAKTITVKSESIGNTNMDEFFDPDGWL